MDSLREGWVGEEFGERLGSLRFTRFKVAWKMTDDGRVATKQGLGLRVQCKKSGD